MPEDSDNRKIIDILQSRLLECISLSLNSEHLSKVSNIISRSIGDLKSLDLSDEIIVKKSFGNLVNKVLSTIEAMGIPDPQYVALRKLVLSDIYSCQNLILKNSK